MLKRFTSAWNPSAIAGMGPEILKRAAVRTVALTIMAILVFSLFAAFAGADATGSNYGGAAAVTAETPGAPTLAEVAADTGTVKIGMNFFFLIMGVCLIFFMQAG
ncbi:MAG TPA: hypothetical protein VFG89_07900, partial [Coriobacteriia bacterium]|nr:hypothetical protein [Coriobacteriia bacterium]